MKTAPLLATSAQQSRFEGIAVSLFSGAGGLDLGLKEAGFRIALQVEADADCASTLGMSASSTDGDRLVISARIEDVPPAAVMRRIGIKRGELDLLAGGPPCQPFTTTGLRMGLTDRRASSAFPTYLTYVKALRPRALVLENVDGFLSAALRHRPMKYRGKGHPELAWEERKGSFLFWFLGELAALGYAVSWGVLDAVGFGVAQHRQRAFLIGIEGANPTFLPAPPMTDQHGWRTLRDAIGRITELGPVQPLSRRKKDVLSRIPPGGNWRDLPEALQQATMGAAFAATGGKSGWWRRLSWDVPAPTVLGMPDHSSTALIHPEEVRCLSLNECAAIQSFPSWVRFSGRPRSQYQQVGNAVPPLVGLGLGNHIAQCLSGVFPPIPQPPEWVKASANRRIGTHGWVRPVDGKPAFRVIAKPREDSVWNSHQITLEHHD
ncbi:MAG: DNA cytosine methyltransferase [Thioalkalivibrio sp.]|nr:DNA cytosine methyltransferase [Thioalkalivibrio sp.]